MLELPEDLIPACRHIKGMNDAEFEHLLGAMTELSGRAALSNFASSVSRSIGMAKPLAMQIVQVIRGLKVMSTNRNLAAGEVIAEVLSGDALSGSGQPKMDRFARRLQSLVENPSITIFDEAHDLTLSRRNLLTSAQILPDMAPVLVDDEIAAMVFLHSLCVEYRADGEPKRMRLTLDREDLLSLIEEAKEAISREERTMDSMEAAGYQCMSWT